MEARNWLTVRAIFDWQLTTTRRRCRWCLPRRFSSASVKRSYYGQNWALGRNQSTNVGAIVDLRMGPFLSLRAGVFRSVNDNPASYTDIYDDVTQAGVADHLVVANPGSGRGIEFRRNPIDRSRLRVALGLTSITLMARGRETSSVYGGSDVVDLGTAHSSRHATGQAFIRFRARDRDVTDLWTTGVAYQLQWQGHGDIATGIQHEWYEESVTGPDSTGKGMVRNPFGNMRPPP